MDNLTDILREAVPDVHDEPDLLEVIKGIEKVLPTLFPSPSEMQNVAELLSKLCSVVAPTREELCQIVKKKAPNVPPVHAILASIRTATCASSASSIALEAIEGHELSTIQVLASQSRRRSQ